MKYDIISTRKIKRVIQIRKPDDIVDFLKRYFKVQQEMFIVVTLNARHEVIGVHIATIGLLNKTIIHPREVFIRAIKDNARSIIVAHNHTSGKSDPSPEDEWITAQLKEAGDIIGIPLIDHLIVSKNGYYSFGEAGKLYDNDDSD